MAVLRVRTVEELRTIVNETHVTQGSSQYNDDNLGWGLYLGPYLLQSLEVLAASELGWRQWEPVSIS